MGKINVLSSTIYNRISAGEVVERPFSVVKELVENSLDAGADFIIIEIEGGGISSIRIKDNGSGIERSDLKKAILPHATSKISTLKDLDNISSLGFRGEALASIASVSKLTITSKTESQELGASIFVEGGEIIGDITDCGFSKGTLIQVDNLFYNTPVRERFLHTARAEENEITSTVARFILGHPDISFKYVADGKIIYQSFGDGMESAMANIYGMDAVINCIKVNAQRNGIGITGYIGKHYYTKGNRSHQTVFINGRHVHNQTVYSAIANAYSSYLMKRQYPFYVISIELPTEAVDVNVHPNKLDVRFVNNQIIYGAIYSIISKILDGTSDALDIVYEELEPKTIEKQPCKYTEEQMNRKYPTHEKPFKLNDDVAKIILKDSAPTAKSIPIKEIEQKKDVANDIFAENKAYLESLEKKKQSHIQETQEQQIKIERNLTIVGQALNTFIILEDGLDLYFIDQHAAHERLLFDKFNKSLKENDIIKQPVLIPFVLNVNNDESQFLSDKLSVLSDMGIEISEFGRNSFKVSAVPAFLSDMNLQQFFNDILAEMDTLRDFTLNDIMIEKIAQKACKSAIKSGDKLSDLELKTLLELLKNNLGLKCPHGRPVAIKISRTEIDKWFKRIV